MPRLVRKDRVAGRFLGARKRPGGPDPGCWPGEESIVAQERSLLLQRAWDGVRKAIETVEMVYKERRRAWTARLRGAGSGVAARVHYQVDCLSAQPGSEDPLHRPPGA